MPKTARIEVRVEPELLERIHSARGDVPLARFVVRALEAALGARVEGDRPANPPEASASPSASPRASKDPPPQDPPAQKPEVRRSKLPAPTFNVGPKRV